MKGMDVVEMLARYFRVGLQDSDNCIEVLVDETLLVRCFYRGDWMYFTGDIAVVQPSDFEKIKRMLQWNLARIAEKNDTLTYDSQTTMLYLLRKKPLARMFADNIFHEAETFVENLTFWREAFLYTGMSSGVMYVNKF